MATKGRRMTKPSKGEFIHRSGFEERKAVDHKKKNVQAYFVEAVPTDRDTLKPVYVA